MNDSCDGVHCTCASHSYIGKATKAQRRLQLKMQRQQGRFSAVYRKALERWYGVLDTEYRRVLGDVHIAKAERAELIAALIAWEILRERGIELLSAAELAMYQQAIAKTIQFSGVGIASNITRARISAIANARAGAMVRNILSGVRKNIRNSIEAGLASGRSIDQMASMIRPGLPALPVSINRINRQFGERLSKGESFLKTRRWAQREMSRMRDYRAHMIARTEASAAMNDGALIAWEEAGFRYVEFVASFDACPECIPYDGEFFPVASQGFIPVHCNGKCVWAVVPKSAEPDVEDVVVTAPDIDPLLPAVALGFLEEEE